MIGSEIFTYPSINVRCILQAFLDEGVPLSHLPDYREEIERLYGRFAKLGGNEAMGTALNKLFEPFSGTLSTELSRIRAAFRSSVGEEMAKHYIVDGASGNPKSILLDRALIDTN